MANLMDISDTLAKEGRLAQSYEQYKKDAVNEDFKKELDELQRLSVEKMRILYKIIKEGPWLNHEQGVSK